MTFDVGDADGADEAFKRMADMAGKHSHHGERSKMKGPRRGK